MNHFSQITLTNAINAWADGKLDETTFAAFFNFVWNKWNLAINKSELDLTTEFQAFSKVGA